MPFTPSRLTALFLVAGLSTVEIGLLDAQMRFGSRAALAQGAMSLRVRRGEGAVEVVIQGVGSQPVLQQRLNGGTWQGSLQTQGSPGILNGIQQLSDPVAGLQRVAMSGSGSAYLLEVVPVPGQTLQEPVVSADGRNLILRFPELIAGPTLQTGRMDLNTPGRVPQSRYAPPLRPRAVAPPLGDMAIGTMVLQNRNYVNVSGPPVTLSLNNAPAKDALMVLAKLGGYGFVYLGGKSEDSAQQVSLSFQQEDYGKAFNSVLLASGLQGRLSGNALFVGETVAQAGLAPTISKVFRLNQVSSDSAAQYLASLGARVCVPTTTTFNSSASSTEGTASASTSQTESSSSEKTEISCYGGTQSNQDSESSFGPLYGLEGTTDGRLSTVTLIGEATQVTVAEKYLRNLDLRKRQVAVKVQILNVDLANDKTIDSSFSARMGNTFIVSESGKAFMNFGDYKPGSSRGVGDYRSTRPDSNSNLYAAPGTYAADIPMQAAQDVVGASVASQSVVNPVIESQRVVDPVVASQQVVDPVVESKEVFKPPYVEAQEIVARKEDGTPIYGPKLDANGIPIYVPSNDPSASPTLVTRYDSSGRPIYIPSTNPATAPTLIPRYDSNGQQIYVPSTNPTATPTLVPRYDSNGQKIYVPSNDPTVAPTLIPRYDSNGRPIYVPSSDPAASPSLVPRYDKNGQPVYVAGKDPGKFSYPQNSLYGYLEAVIQSTSAKVLASPTLLVQEGEEGKVETGTSYITGVTATETANGSTQYQNTREIAGLTLKVNVEKIDDNGFVTMSIAPSISIPQSTDVQNDVIIYNITTRALNSGRVRLRDRQTLVLTGVIRDSDVETVTKWPLLGDLPIIGQFFRKSASAKTKNELVILVTPSIVDDESGGAYGYGYRPSTREARQLMGPR